MVSDFVAPKPNEPSRNARGTCVIMSSDNDETKGIIMMPMTKPAVSALVALMCKPTDSPSILKNGPMIISANTP
ncbi:hypothetical protein D3C80_1783480 [compost metagenome]